MNTKDLFMSRPHQPFTVHCPVPYPFFDPRGHKAYAYFSQFQDHLEANERMRKQGQATVHTDDILATMKKFGAK